LRVVLAVVAGKVAGFLSRIGGYQGSSLPGRIARRVDGGVLTKLAGQVRRGIILVSGTNGKTTTVNMIADVLRHGGYRVTANQEGANMLNGVTAAFVKDADCLGRIRSDFAVIEGDEAYVPGIVREIKPGLVVVTNISQDQMDRHGEPERILGIIAASLKGLKNTVLALNGDDPAVAYLASRAELPAVYFGMAVVTHAATKKSSGPNRIAATLFCPHCDSILYSFGAHNGHLGGYRCDNCGFAKPDQRVEALEAVAVGDAYLCVVDIDGSKEQLTLQAKGLFNVMNAMAAITACLHSGMEIATILSGMAAYKPVTGRMEKYLYKGKTVFLVLVKNLVGFSEALAALREEPESMDILIALNDQEGDGQDLSWLWEVDFETLINQKKNLHSFTCTGQRGADAALRLKYADVPRERIALVPDLSQAVKQALGGRGEKVYLLVNYTLLQQVSDVLGKINN